MVHKHMKSCSMSPIIKETGQSHMRTAITKNKPKIPRVGGDVEKLEPLCLAGGNVKGAACYIQYVHCMYIHIQWKTVWCFHYSLNLKLLSDPASPFLDVSSKQLRARTQADTCTPMFLALLFTIAGKPKQAMRPSRGEWRNKTSHVDKWSIFSNKME